MAVAGYSSTIRSSRDVLAFSSFESPAAISSNFAPRASLGATLRNFIDGRRIEEFVPAPVVQLGEGSSEDPFDPDLLTPGMGQDIVDLRAESIGREAVRAETPSLGHEGRDAVVGRVVLCTTPGSVRHEPRSHAEARLGTGRCRSGRLFYARRTKGS